MARILLAGALLTFVVVGGWQLTVPGLYYDELLFVDAALGHPNGQFRDFSLGPVPIMLMTYIGALKAWLYSPIFQLFGVSAYSVRLPVLLIGALTLWVNAKMLERAFSRQAALVFLPLAAVEPSTLLHTRLDWGPTALMMLLRALLLLGIVSWIRTREPRFLWLALGAAALGTFDKLNFLWFAPALLLALVLVYPGVIHSCIAGPCGFAAAPPVPGSTRGRRRGSGLAAGLYLTGGCTQRRYGHLRSAVPLCRGAATTHR
ncbi:MAG: glycosyltransferase family 39 protein [Pseudohongiellaceae bacterium]